MLEIVKRDAAAKTGQPVDEMELQMMKMMLTQQIDGESNAWFATARLWDDGVIDPRDTRHVVGIALSVCHTKPVEGTTSCSGSKSTTVGSEGRPMSEYCSKRASDSTKTNRSLAAR